MYLRAALLIVRYRRAGGFLILHPRSASILPTDALGAQAVRQFRLGQSAEVIGRRLGRQCPDAEKRWRRLVGALYDVGAVSPQASRRTRRWWMRTVASVGLGPVLSLLTFILSVAPLWVLLRLYAWLPSTPVSARTLDHLLPFIEANLCAAGYADRPPAWRRIIAQRVTAATIRTHYVTYLMLILPREKVIALVEKLTLPRGMARLQQIYTEYNGAIVVGLHWELFTGLIMQVSNALPATLLANIDLTEYGVAAERELPFASFSELVSSTALMAAKSLIHCLRSGRVVMLAVDVAPSPDSHGTWAKRIHFLNHDVARFDTAAWLAVRTGKPILFAKMYWESNRLAIDFSAPLLPEADRSPHEQIAHLTAAVYETAEQVIRKHPDAWLVWSYLHTLSVPSK